MRKVVDAKGHASKGSLKGSLHVHAEQIKLLLGDIGRLKSIRDPIGDLGHELTSPQLHAILWLGVDGPLPSNILAQRIGCLQPSVTGVVDRLEKLAYVERVRDTEDRRVVRVRLTAAGNAAYRRIDKEITKQIELFLGILSDDDRAALVRILGRVVQVMKAPAPGGTRPRSVKGRKP